MQYFILLLFSMSFSMGIYLILAHLLKIPTFRARRAVLSMGRQKKRKAGSSDAAIMELAVKLSPFVPMDAYKRRKLVMVLHSAGIKETPEVYLAQAYVKSGLVFSGALPCLAVFPLLAPAFLIMGCSLFRNRKSREGSEGQPGGHRVRASKICGYDHTGTACQPRRTVHAGDVSETCGSGFKERTVYCNGGHADGKL